MAYCAVLAASAAIFLAEVMAAGIRRGGGGVDYVEAGGMLA